MKVVQEHPLPSFFAAAYAISWVFWLPAVAASIGWIPSVPSALLHLAEGTRAAVLCHPRHENDRRPRGSNATPSPHIQGDWWVGTAILIRAFLFMLSTLVVIGIYRERITWQ